MRHPDEMRDMYKIKVEIEASGTATATSTDGCLLSSALT
jgi:hypothetical protein